MLRCPTLKHTRLHFFLGGGGSNELSRSWTRICLTVRPMWKFLQKVDPLFGFKVEAKGNKLFQRFPILRNTHVVASVVFFPAALTQDEPRPSAGDVQLGEALCVSRELIWVARLFWEGHPFWLAFSHPTENRNDFVGSPKERHAHIDFGKKPECKGLRE